MSLSGKRTGEKGEELAALYLTDEGYRIIERNYRCRFGEIDIVAEENDTLVFVEVRAKSGRSFGTPEESVTAAKKERLITTALTYLTTHEDMPDSWRIDFLAIEVDDKGKTKRIELIENAIN